MKTPETVKSMPPGNFGLPVIGETISFLTDPDFSNKRYQKYGPIFKTHIFGRPTVMMIGSEANRFLLSIASGSELGNDSEFPCSTTIKPAFCQVSPPRCG